MITSSAFSGLVIICLLPWPVAAQNRIVGGSATTVAQYPYMVYLNLYNDLHCGGSLIAAQFVLTAGHCIYQVDSASLSVVAGTSYANTGNGETRQVIATMLPKGYNRNTRHMDVGVVKMKSPFNGSNIQVIPLCSATLRVGNRLTVTGWGRLSETGRYPVQLQAVEVPLIGRAKCKRQYRYSAPITKSMFCAQARGKDACSGDSGGPVVYNGQVCGIVSWGYGCARTNYAGVYTSVNYVKSFIVNALKK